ncbi:dUTP diphosphatase [Paenibacillus cisolokensis]|uniref:dUTP diphosphatase n=1 Tax=Paenibacillus cisolokensis TaxID=1658519 RepID=UPI003D2DC15A
MTITLEQMYEMQKELDARIIREKGLEGQDLLPNTVLALQVEIGELANEWRGFKHWSNDREPRTVVQVTCPTCKGKGEVPDLADGMGYTFCPDCGRSGQVIVNKLLEEYVDCLHFFLSIARQLELPADDLYAWEDDPEGETNILFIELLHNVGLIIGDQFLFHKPEDVKEWRREHLRSSLFIFYALGEKHLGFTFDQIATAYVEKNRVNHERQANGY